MNSDKLDDKAHWDAKYRDKPESWIEPDEFLKVAYSEFLAGITPGSGLDLAGGAGRNAAFLTQRGWQMTVVDISGVGLQLAREKAAALKTETVDLRKISNLGKSKYDLIAVFYFLRRELFPALISALKPNGFLIYRTYTIDQQKLGRGPGDPQFLLQPNELLQAFTSLRIWHYRERIADKATAELVAQKSTQQSAHSIHL